MSFGTIPKNHTVRKQILKYSSLYGDKPNTVEPRLSDIRLTELPGYSTYHN